MTIEFRDIQRRDGYLPIEDHGVIGDGTTAALVGRDGTIDWMCAPRFDSPPLFASLLDAGIGGRFSIVPEGPAESRQRYEEGTPILVTELRTPAGMIELTDALTIRAGADLTEDVSACRGELLRRIRCIEGEVPVRFHLQPHGGAEWSPHGDAARLSLSRRPSLDLYVGGSLGITGPDESVTLRQGDERFVLLRWGGGSLRGRVADPEALLEQTAEAWRRWIGRLRYSGRYEAKVRRAAITLKLLDYFESGASVAAVTSSLPAPIGGVRNWDYRYTWIRDASFTSYALRRINYPRESWYFLAWALGATEGDERPLVLYDVEGHRPPEEREDGELEGYRGSDPVRWGNAAANQRQHDIFGEIVDCAWLWVRGGGSIDRPLWERLRGFIDRAGEEWRTADHGIWEVRTPGRPFTYSAALCHVALDRGARLSERLNLPGEPDRWRREADEIRTAILEEAWSEEHGAITEHLDGSGGLDASLLSLPLRRVVPFDHPRMVATVETIGRELDAGGGLLYRYRAEESPDGLPGEEGAFLLASFWMVDNLVGQGRLDEAEQLFESLCARTNAVGLLPEQLDPSSGAFLGNFPQAFSHIGLISSAANISRARGSGKR